MIACRCPDGRVHLPLDHLESDGIVRMRCHAGYSLDVVTPLQVAVPARPCALCWQTVANERAA